MEYVPHGPGRGIPTPRDMAETDRLVCCRIAAGLWATLARQESGVLPTANRNYEARRTDLWNDAGKKCDRPAAPYYITTRCRCQTTWTNKQNPCLGCAAGYRGSARPAAEWLVGAGRRPPVSARPP